MYGNEQLIDMAGVFIEKPGPAEELPEGWSEVYYAEQTVEVDGEEYVFVKALYEHVPSAVKVVVEPPTAVNARVEPPSKMNVEEMPKHRVVAVEPLYEDILSLLYYDRGYELDDVLYSALPELSRDESSGKRLTIHTEISHPESEDAYEWDLIPDEALERLQTYRQYPLDYSPLFSRSSPLRTLYNIAEEYDPEILPEPIEATVLVSASPETDEKRLELDRQLPENKHEALLSLDRGVEPLLKQPGGDNRHRSVQENPILRLSESDFEELEPGTELATIYVELDPDGWRHHRKFRVTDITYTEVGKQLISPLYRTRIKVKERLNALISS